MTALFAAIDVAAAGNAPVWAAAAAVAAGGIVGLSLGLTGGGGAIFAVPLLVYWIGVDPRTAVSISLVTVAVTAVVGAMERWWYGHVGTSLLVITLVGASAVASQGMAGRAIPSDVAACFVAGSVPTLFAGSWIGRRLGGPTLARVFAVAILCVALFVIVKSALGS